MSEEKDQRIWEEVKRRAKEQVRFGIMNLEVKVQNGKIIAIEIISERIKIA